MWKDGYWHRESAIGRLNTWKLAYSRSLRGCLLARTLDFEHTASCSRGPGSLTDNGAAISHFCQTRRKSKPSVTARQSAQWRGLCCTRSGSLSHTYQWPRTSSSLLIFCSCSLECAAVCPCVWVSGCASGRVRVRSHLLTAGRRVCEFVQPLGSVCLLSTGSALMRQVTVWVWAMEQSVSRPTDYRLALHDNTVEKTLVSATKEGTGDNGWKKKLINVAFKGRRK